MTYEITLPDLGTALMLFFVCAPIICTMTELHRRLKQSTQGFRLPFRCVTQQSDATPPARPFQPAHPR